MAYKKRGFNPISLANLNKGMNVSKLMHVDPKTQELANVILDQETEYNGEIMTNREAILRLQLTQAINGNLRSCQFLIDLAEGNKQTDTETPFSQII